MSENPRVAGLRGADRRVVGIGNYEVTASGETLIAYGLGACVGIGLSDPDGDVHALAHVVLPREPSGSTAPPGKFADTTVQAMLREMVEHGASYESVEAWLVGGAEIFPVADLDLAPGTGEETAAAAREQLAALDVPVVAQSVGGERGRTVEFDTATGDVLCRYADGEPQFLRANDQRGRGGS